jgi:hypothetical protein
MIKKLSGMESWTINLEAKNEGKNEHSIQCIGAHSKLILFRRLKKEQVGLSAFL